MYVPYLIIVWLLALPSPSWAAPGVVLRNYHCLDYMMFNTDNDASTKVGQKIDECQEMELSYGNVGGDGKLVVDVWPISETRGDDVRPVGSPSRQQRKRFSCPGPGTEYEDSVPHDIGMSGGNDRRSHIHTSNGTEHTALASRQIPNTQNYMPFYIQLSKDRQNVTYGFLEGYSDIWRKGRYRWQIQSSAGICRKLAGCPAFTISAKSSIFFSGCTD